MTDFPTRELTPLPPPPPWGRLTDEGKFATVIRFVTADGTFSWPCHGLIRWEWKSGEAQSLTIYAAGASITVTGRRLDVLRDALDAGRLERVQLMTDRTLGSDTEPQVRGITIAPR